MDHVDVQLAKLLERGISRILDRFLQSEVEVPDHHERHKLLRFMSPRVTSSRNMALVTMFQEERKGGCREWEAAVHRKE